MECRTVEAGAHEVEGQKPGEAQAGSGSWLQGQEHKFIEGTS